jgi:putative phage-type endonuclease
MSTNLLPAENTSNQPRILAKLSDGRENWLAHRKVGASDAPVILGISPYGKTPERLRLEKVGHLESTPSTERMELGSLLEPMIGTLFGVRSGLDVFPSDHLYGHPDLDWMTATPDAMVVDPSRGEDDIGVVQIKNVGEYNAHRWADGPPADVVAQVQHELCVTGKSYGYAVALLGGNRLVYHQIERDDVFIAEMIEAERLFWFHVEADLPLPLTADDTATVEALYPRATEETIELHPDALVFVEEYDRARRDADDADERKQRAANCLRAMLGSAKEGRIGSYRVRWINQERKGHVVAPSTFRKFEVRTVKS